MSLLRTLMAPIGRPENVTGMNPIFREPEPIVPPGPPIRPPRRPRPRPMPLPMVPPPSLPIRTGGLGELAPIRFGVSPTQDSRGGSFISQIRDAIKQNPDMVRQGGGFLGKRSGPDPELIKIPNLIGFDKPPSIGGAGGTDFEDKRSLGKERSSLGPPRRPPVAGGASLLQRNKPIPLEDFGFGPGTRPTEMIGPDGQFIGSAGVTPPGGGQDPVGTARTMDFQDTDMNGVDDRDQPNFSGPSQEYLDQQKRMQDIFNQKITPDPIIEPAPTTPAAVAPDVGAVPDTTMPMGAIDPVLTQQATAETLTDPLIRSLYFGTQDSPGFFQQLQQAGANLIGSDVPLQQTAGLTPLELLARQQAVAGIGGFEPFLQQNRDLVNQAIEQSRRAEQLQDPYYTQAEQIYQDTMGAYDPSMTQQFYNPFEDAVVQQTIDDVLEAGEQQDIAARAREIGAGAFGGSRARLGAMERREALGEGLAQALANIRQQGFSEAQRTGLGEFARQQQAKRTGAEGLIGIGTGRGRAASNLAQNLAGLGGELTGLGQTQEALRSGQRSELAGFGSTGRGIEETGLSRIYQQQLGQQQRPLGVLGQIGSMLPGYQASRTQIDSQYGMPTDPTAAGLGAAFSAYGALAPRQGSS